MRRDELFTLLPLPHKIGRREGSTHKAADCFSCFSCMEPAKNTPVFRRPKGASTASSMRRQTDAETG